MSIWPETISMTRKLKYLAVNVLHYGVYKQYFGRANLRQIGGKPCRFAFNYQNFYLAPSSFYSSHNICAMFHKGFVRFVSAVETETNGLKNQTKWHILSSERLTA